MKSIKILVSLSLAFLCFLATPLKAVTTEELQEFAIRNNDSELIEILMKYSYSKENPILNTAMINKDYSAVFTLVEYGVEINSRSGIPPYNINGSKYSSTVLEMAIRENEISLVEYFLFNKADPTNRFHTYETKIDYVPYKSSRTDYITTAVYDAIMLGRLDFLILFVQYGADMNKPCYETTYSNKIISKTPLKVASENKQRDIISFLLSIGVEI